MAKAVAAEGVTVNTISPGAIHSDKLDTKFRGVASRQGPREDAPWRNVEQAALPLFAIVPVGRVGTLDEIADAVCYLVSPRAGYITGSNIRLDGGMLPTLEADDRLSPSLLMWLQAALPVVGRGTGFCHKCCANPAPNRCLPSPLRLGVGAGFPWPKTCDAVSASRWQLRSSHHGVRYGTGMSNALSNMQIKT